MLITLPIEVWLDILDWLIHHRREVALKFNELGDRQFNEITQKWLHEKTKNIEIGKLRVINPRSKLYIEGNEGFLLEIVATKDSMQQTTASLFSYRTNLGIGYLVTAQFAEVPMPENITDFKKLTITFLDYNSLQFIRKMGSLFANIRLEITLRKVEKLEPTRDALMNHLLPLFIGIKTIVLMNFPQLLFAIRAQFPAKLSAITFINLLLHEGPITDELAAFIVGWLCEQRRAATNEVEEPRMFALNVWEPTSLQLIETIREQFLLSTTPISFFFCFFGHSLGQLDTVQDMTELNARTDEKFVIQKREVDGQLLIGRCPSKYKENWLLKMEHKMADEIYWSGKRKIELEVEAIGRMEATDLVVEEEVVIDQQEQPGPSGSKKRKLN